jgi:phage terminase large subunit
LLILGATKPLRVLCARETQKSIAESVHKLLSDQIVSLNLTEFYTVQETTIIGRNGTNFTFSGLRQHGVASIKSYEGVDVCWVEEGQTVTKKSWDVLVPTIRKPESEIWVTFNPELETDETYRRFVSDPPDGAVLLNVNWSDNPWFPEELDFERRQLKRRDPIEYETVWEGKCRPAVDGAIYLHEIRRVEEGGRLRHVPYDPMLKVHTAWDLGFNDAMTIICFQRSASEVRVIDYIEDSHRRLDEYVSELKAKDYNWGTDYLPHDGNSKNLQTGRSAKDVLQAYGREVQVIPRDDPERGIRNARMVFDRCYFDKTKAGRLVECLKRYRRAINVNTGEPTGPVHDEYSHGADAFRYMCAVVDQASNDDWGGKLKYDHRGII